MKEVLSILWDWNGTLLNDLDLNLRALNSVVTKRGINKLSVDDYKNNFKFPVQTFYEELGFDFNKESFTSVSNEFLHNYLENIRLAHLHEGIIDALKYFKNNGVTQYILSAMQLNDLKNTLYSKGISHYFNRIEGLHHRAADSKISVGKDLLKKERLDPEKTLLIGDTVHDAEVAEAMGCQVILIANGHNDTKRLKETGAKVYDSIGTYLKEFQSKYSFV